MADPKYTIQEHFGVGNNDNTDPDSCSFDTTDQKRTGVPKGTTIMLRFTIANTGGKDTGVSAWRLHYNTTDTFTGATQITTSTANHWVMATGQPTDQAVTDAQVLGGTGTRVDGYYVESTSTETSTMKIPDGEYAEFQFCVQATVNAIDGQDYYFFISEAGAVLDDWGPTNAIQLEVITTTSTTTTVETHEITTELDAYLTELDVEITAEIDALLYETITEDIDLDAILYEVNLITTDLDALLYEVLTSDVDLDALLKEVDLTETTDLDGLLYYLGTEEVDLDALLYEIFTKTVDLDALLSEVNLTISTELDAYLKEVDLTEITDIDAILVEVNLMTTDIDAILQEVGLIETSDLDAILTGVEIITTNLDAQLAYLGMKSVDLDAILFILGQSYVWGHDTLVDEDIIVNLSEGSGTATVMNPGVADTEKLRLYEGDYWELPAKPVGVGDKRIRLDKYASGYDGSITIKYRTGGTQAICEAAGYNTYSGGALASSGWVQIRIEAGA